MESLCNYASDDNSSSPKREIASKFTRSNGMEADANYEQVTMDLSEQESNHSPTKSPQHKDRTSPSSTVSSSMSRSPRSHRTRKYESHSDIKTSSSDEEKTKSHKRHKKHKSKDRHNKKRSRQSRSRSRGKKHSRKSSHSRSKKRSRRSRSRSERNDSSKKSSPYSKHDVKSQKKSSRSNSKEKFTLHNYFIEKKANNKRQILDKLGIELKVPSIGTVTLPPITQVTPQQILQKSMEAQVEKVKVQTGIELPSYYNPVAVNPNKYAEQIQKRKLLWGNKQNNVIQKVETKPIVTTANKTATIWQSTKFGDQDGKVTAKFKRLMGIKDNDTDIDNQTGQQGQSKDIIKKQEEMFNSMESQYEVARMATHTHRGLGLGFGTFQQR